MKIHLGVLAIAMAACSDTIAPPPSGEDPERLEDVVDENDAKIETAEHQARRSGDYRHFYGITNESVAEFDARAEQRIAELEADRDALLARARDHSDPGPHRLLELATASLQEARRDLEEVRTQSARIFDDGRLGVSVAINRAQRELTGARRQLRELQY